jgi:two-component system sensor histidine kinase UhpB
MSYPVSNIFFMLDQIREGLVILDKDFNYKYVNKTAALVLGKPVEEIIDKDIFTVSPNVGISKTYQLITSTLKDGEHREWEEYFPNGKIWIQFFANKVSDELHIFFRDITVKKAVIKNANDERERFVLAAKATADMIWDWNLLTDDIWWNDNFYIQLGYVRNKNSSNIEFWNNNIHPNDKDRIISGIEHVFKNKGEYWVDEYRFRMANGNYAYILDRGFVTYNEEGTAIKMIGAMMNFTDKKEKEMRLLELSSKLHSVVEEERSHLAREIHDELGQQLTLLKLELNRIKKFLPENPEEALQHLNHSLETVTGSIKSVKNLSFELHPQLIRELGLNEALDRYMQNFAHRSGLKCILHIADNFNCNNESTSLTIYRIVQEALSNVIRHAKATEARVKIESTKHQWLISIEDNGTGMTEKPDDKFSLGLTGMKERAHMINAEFEIISNAGGTKINIVIPIR